MIKHLNKISGVAAFAALAASASAEVKLTDNFSIEGYAVGSAVVTEPSPKVKDKVFFDSGNAYDSAKVALNGKYDAFTSKVSGYLVDKDAPANGLTRDFGLLDAYVSYTKDEWVITGGKYLGWLGYESFDSPNNDFISSSQATYSSPYSTGAKVEYITKAYSTGVSVRDSQFGSSQGVTTGKFFQGDGNFGNDLGYEAYFLYTGVDKLKVFAGMGYQDVKDNKSYNTYDVWASYDLTSKFTLVGEYATVEDATDYTWNLLAKYALTADLSVAARTTGAEAANLAGGGKTFGYGLASTYTLTKNFAVKAEVTNTEKDLGADDVFSYALQGVLKF
jgi:Putative beta-barrel porin-2, OmpL-like. bbp2